MKKGKLLLTSLLASVLVVGGTLVSCGTTEEDPTTIQDPDGETTGGEQDPDDGQQDPDDGGDEEPEETVTLVSIEVTSLPDKTEYVVNEAFDSTGLEVTATYSNDTEAVVEGYTLSGADTSTLGENIEVTVTYTEGDVTETATFEIEVGYSVTYQASENDPSNFRTVITSSQYTGSFNLTAVTEEDTISIAQPGDTVYFQYYTNYATSYVQGVKVNGESEGVSEESAGIGQSYYHFTMPNENAVITVEFPTAYTLSFETDGDYGDATIAYTYGGSTFDNTITKAYEGMATAYLCISADFDTTKYTIEGVSMVDENNQSVGYTYGSRSAASATIWYYYKITSMPASNVHATITFGTASE